MDSVITIVWIVSFVIVTVTVTGLSRRIGWSAPVSLVAVGFFTWLVVPAITLATVLEGESLFNDAAALVALAAATTAIVGTIHPWLVAGDFVLAIVVGVAFGIAVGFGLSTIRRRLTSPVLDTPSATPFTPTSDRRNGQVARRFDSIGTGAARAFWSPAVSRPAAIAASRWNPTFDGAPGPEWRMTST